jgi:hypothetical protein
MAEDDFSKIVRNAGKALSNDSKAALDWFYDTIDDVKKPKSKPFTKDSMPKVGRMYLFAYDPKHKDKLPFYDAFPLVFPIEFYIDGILGINLHYLPYMQRTQLMSALQSITNNNKYNETTKLNISYELLSRYANQFKGFESCVKRYLYGHVRSSFHEVYPYYWGKAIILPLQRWKVNPNKRYSGSPPY